MKEIFLIRIILLSSFCTYGFGLNAQSVSGTVRSAANGEALPFAPVSVVGTTKGTVTNEKGEFILHLTNGKYTLSVKYLGYKTKEFEIQVPASQKLNFTLEEEDLSLPDVVITTDGEDPAYGIIRKAIQRKELNDMPFESWTYNQYSKTAVRYLTERDSAVPAFLKNVFMNGNDSIRDEKGFVYLEENQAEEAFRRPDLKQEKITSTRISGNKNEFGYVSNLFLQYLDFTPYKSYLEMGEIAERGIVSPLSGSAFVFYNFKLLGVGHDRGKTYYKIAIIPKRKNDPVMQGEIYILDSLYAVKGLDVSLSKENQIQYFDSLRIIQEFIPLNDSVWAPFKIRYEGKMNVKILVVSVILDATFLGVMREYNIEDWKENKQKRNEVIAFGDSALVHDSIWWNETRPVPLEEDEARDFHVKDSLHQITNNPKHLDSLAKATRKFKPFSFLFSGYHPDFPGKKFKMDFPSGITMVNFNPMEGTVFFFHPQFHKGFSETNRLLIEPKLRYGFAANLFGYSLSITWKPTKIRKESIQISGGDIATEISGFNQIDPLVNAVYSLIERTNYFKLYRRKWVFASWKRELFNGFVASAGCSFEERIPMMVSTNYSWKNDAALYPPNLGFLQNRAVIAKFGFEFQPGNKYMKLRKEKMNFGSKWPEFYGNFTQAIPGILSAKTNFSAAEIGIKSDLSLRLLGKLSWEVNAGRFFTNQNSFIPDRFHFQSNQTVFRNENLKQFSLMNYYAWSTTGTFIQAHGEQSFGGWILNKIPGVKKLGLSEYVGSHFLYSPGKGMYPFFE